MLHVDDPQLITLIPREGTETLNNLAHHIIKRQGIRLITLIPREGTETHMFHKLIQSCTVLITLIPREGTET